MSLTLSCSGAPSLATCTVPTSAVVATPATPGAFTVTVTTTSSGQSLASVGDGFMPKGMWLALIPFGMIMLSKLRKRRKLLLGLFLLVTLAAAISGVGCTGPGVKGSATSTPGTPTGTYTGLTVTATSGGVIEIHDADADRAIRICRLCGFRQNAMQCAGLAFIWPGTFTPNKFTQRATYSTCPVLSAGNIGSDRIRRATRSVTDKSQKR